jgi:hypothetical protein
MISALVRKARQVADDPVLRRWLLLRLFGRTSGEPLFTPHRPPYLEGMLPLGDEEPASKLREIRARKLKGPIDLPLPGLTLHVKPGEEGAVFRRSFADTETLLAVHRFAWLPLLGDKADSAWVQALWTAWRETHGEPGNGRAWHPYTAAERAVNILRYAGGHGLPGPKKDTLDLLAAHGPVMARGLEYFGDHHTSNHLSNNGRGLFILGLELGLADCAKVGSSLLLEEAKRIFRPSGILREGSSHYHLLLTRNYAEAWLAAHKHKRPEEPALKDIVTRALAVVPRLVLPGGMPLVGDISPDCPPPFLEGLVRGAEIGDGWVRLLDGPERVAFAWLRDETPLRDRRSLAADGWLRADFGPWSGLWHAAPDGWSHMPGHGHQDCGGFELHFGDEPVFVDPGRGTYDTSGDGPDYRTSLLHNTLLVDDADCHAPNRPYYDAAFRGMIGGRPPVFEWDRKSVRLSHEGFSRLKDVGSLIREWSFKGSALTMTDGVSGTGRHVVRRRLHTPCNVMPEPGGAILTGLQCAFRLSCTDPINIGPATRWRAYGESAPAQTIDIAVEADLPWQSTITIEPIK